MLLLIVTIYNMKVWGGGGGDGKVKNLSIEEYIDKIKP